MKLSELSTDKAADVLIALTPFVSNIAKDETLVTKIGNAVKTEGMNRMGIFSAAIDKIAALIPLLLEAHRADLFGILSIISEKPVEEIASQSLMATMNDARNALDDKELILFFKSFTPEVKMA